MRKKYILLSILIFTIWGSVVMAEEGPENILNAIVKIEATVPPDARTARTLGAQRVGNGVVIDDKGHILTIGYLVIEAERIEVTGAQGDPVRRYRKQPLEQRRQYRILLLLNLTLEWTLRWEIHLH